MVAGHLTLKNGKYYAVLNYKNAGGQRKTKWISLGLSEKGNKRKAESTQTSLPHHEGPSPACQAQP